MQKGPYTEEEIKYVLENKDKLSANRIGINIGRSKHSILVQLWKRGIQKAPKYDKSWTEDQISFFQKHAGKLSHEEIGKVIGKTKAAISAMGFDLRIDSTARKGLRNDAWTKNDIDYLKKNYGKIDLETICKNLNRSDKGVLVKATRLNLKTERAWTKEEINFLKENHNKLSNYEIGKILERSTIAIYKKRFKLGINIKKKSKITFPEAKMIEIVQFLNLEYLFQYKVGRYITDIYIPSFNLIIEVFGDYWHGNQNIYKKLRGFQKEKIEKDKIRHQYIVSKGYEVVNFWETEILKNPEQVIQILKNKIYGESKTRRESK